MNIELPIERLILDGFTLSRNEGVLAKPALDAELVPLPADARRSRIFKAAASLVYEPAEAIPLVNGINPIELGRQIAQPAYGGICK